jgi:hypothetical protein
MNGYTYDYGNYGFYIPCGMFSMVYSRYVNINLKININVQACYKGQERGYESTRGEEESSSKGDK